MLRTAVLGAGCPGVTGIRARWEKVWIYRKHFDSPGHPGDRVFIDFGGCRYRPAALTVDGSGLPELRPGWS